jgi:hypothetical protein
MSDLENSPEMYETNKRPAVGASELKGVVMQPMTKDEGIAYQWALSTPYSSVAARYAGILARYIERHNAEVSRAHDKA